MLAMARKSSKTDKAKRKSAQAEDAGAKKKSADSTQAQPGPRKSVWREYFESAIYTAIMFVFFITFIGRTVGVPSGSMLNTINIGDHFLINKFIFAPGSHPFFLPQREIRRGDIIVFKYPGDRFNPGRDENSIPPVTPYKDYFIKRVIGLPGEKIEVRGTDIFINGQILPEYKVYADKGMSGGMYNEKANLEVKNAPPRKGDELPYTVYYSAARLNNPPGQTEQIPSIFQHEGSAVEKPFTIPPNNYFVMGDNRDDSADSRAFGTVEADLIVGRALFNFWSYDESAPSTNPLVDFFTNTRWRRTGTMIK
jgi:signal peptidase I